MRLVTSAARPRALISPGGVRSTVMIGIHGGVRTVVYGRQGPAGALGVWEWVRVVGGVVESEFRWQDLEPLLGRLRTGRLIR